MAVEVVTFGCRLNTVESELIRRAADAAGLAELQAAVQAVENAVSEPKLRAFWWAAGG